MLFITLQNNMNFPGSSPYKESCSDQSSMMYAWLWLTPIGMTKVLNLTAAASNLTCSELIPQHFFTSAISLLVNQLCHFFSLSDLGQDYYL